MFVRICLGLLALAAGAAETPHSFVGETLTYRLRYGVIKAGTATFNVAQDTDFSKEPALRFTMEAKTTPFIDRIY